MRVATSSWSSSALAVARLFNFGSEPLVVIHRAGQQVERHLVRRAASLRGEPRQLRLEFGRNLQVHEISVGCLDIGVNRRLALIRCRLRRASYAEVQTGVKLFRCRTHLTTAPGGKYVLFLDLLGFTAFVRSSFQKKAEETDDREKEFELAQKQFKIAQVEVDREYRGGSMSISRTCCADQLPAAIRPPCRSCSPTARTWCSIDRSLRHLILLLDELAAVGVAFVSLNEGIDTGTPAGRLQLHILGAIAQFERDRIRERVVARLARAKAQGKRLGRPRKAPATIAVPGGTVREAARVWGVSKSTAARWIREGRSDSILPSHEPSADRFGLPPILG